MSDFPTNIEPGTRILWCGYYSNPRYDTHEVTVLEWSPSKKRVKVRHANGHECWTDLELDERKLLEVLP